MATSFLKQQDNKSHTICLKIELPDDCHGCWITGLLWVVFFLYLLLLLWIIPAESKFGGNLWSFYINSNIIEAGYKKVTREGCHAMEFGVPPGCCFPGRWRYRHPHLNQTSNPINPTNPTNPTNPINPINPNTPPIPSGPPPRPGRRGRRPPCPFPLQSGLGAQ
jgi:hypothetical protein